MLIDKIVAYFGCKNHFQARYGKHNFDFWIRKTTFNYDTSAHLVFKLTTPRSRVFACNHWTRAPVLMAKFRILVRGRTRCTLSPHRRCSQRWPPLWNSDVSNEVRIWSVLIVCLKVTWYNYWSMSATRYDFVASWLVVLKSRDKYWPVMVKSLFLVDTESLHVLSSVDLLLFYAFQSNWISTYLLLQLGKLKMVRPRDKSSTNVLVYRCYPMHH